MKTLILFLMLAGTAQGFVRTIDGFGGDAIAESVFPGVRDRFPSLVDVTWDSTTGFAEIRRWEVFDRPREVKVLEFEPISFSLPFFFEIPENNEIVYNGAVTLTDTRGNEIPGEATIGDRTALATRPTGVSLAFRPDDPIRLEAILEPDFPFLTLWDIERIVARKEIPEPSGIAQLVIGSLVVGVFHRRKS